jgi:hypothetical protein
VDGWVQRSTGRHRVLVLHRHCRADNPIQLRQHVRRQSQLSRGQILPGVSQ